MDFYFWYVLTVMFIFPVTAIAVEFFLAKENTDPRRAFEIVAKWFIAALGLRSLTAGLSQAFNPAFTASLLQIPHSSFVAVREIGYANMAMGITALASLVLPSWRKAAGFCAGLYYGMAGFLHISRIPGGINAHETIAMVSDLLIFLIIAAYLAHEVRLKKMEKHCGISA